MATATAPERVSASQLGGAPFRRHITLPFIFISDYFYYTRTASPIPPLYFRNLRISDPFITLPPFPFRRRSQAEESGQPLYFSLEEGPRTGLAHAKAAATETHPATVPAPASPAQQCTLRQLPDQTGAILPSPEHISRTSRRCSHAYRAWCNRCRVLSAGWWPERYRWQYMQSMAYAMYVHIPAASTQKENHRPYLPMHLQVPRKHAQ